MAQITLQGDPINTNGQLPELGSKAPDFLLTTKELQDVTLADYAGKLVVLTIFPSIDTSICATSARRFNSEIDQLANAVCLCISRDLPFALARFCGAEGLEKIIPLSELRNLNFGRDYGVRIVDGPIAGLLARSVVVLDQQGVVIHRQLVPEIKEEPDYQAALQVLQK